MRKYLAILICVMLFLILISCSDELSVTQRLATVDVTMMPTQITFQLPFYGTPDKFEKVYNDPRQITDGNLKLNIREEGNNCYRRGTYARSQNGEFTYTFGDPAPIIATFENLTNKSITIVDYGSLILPSRLAMGHSGNLISILTTLDGQRIITSEDAQSVGYREYPTPPSISIWELSSKNSISTNTKYIIPTLVLVMSESGQTDFIQIPAGKYLLKYVYFATGYQDTWDGIISSNQIEICILE